MVPSHRGRLLRPGRTVVDYCGFLQTLHFCFDELEQFFEGHISIEHAKQRVTVQPYLFSRMYQSVDGFVDGKFVTFVQAVDKSLKVVHCAGMSGHVTSTSFPK